MRAGTVEAGRGWEGSFVLEVADFHLRCEGCDRKWLPDILQRHGVSHCRDCGGNAWKIEAIVAGKEKGADAGAVGLAAMAGGAGLAGAVVGAAFAYGNSEAGKDGVFVADGVEEAFVAALLQMGRGKQLAAVAQEVEQSRARRRDALDAALGSDGVDCLACCDRFLPKSSATRLGIRAGSGVSESDRVCSARCAGRLREVRCGACGKRFQPPKNPWKGGEKAATWKPKAWHVDGFCSGKCHRRKADVLTCGQCGLGYLVPKGAEKRPGGLKPWFAGGRCSHECERRHERGRPPSPPPGGRVSATCPSGHAISLPSEYGGLLVLCPKHLVRMKVPRAPRP